MRPGPGPAVALAVALALATGCNGKKDARPPVPPVVDAGASDESDSGVAAIDLDDMRFAAVEKALNDTVVDVQRCWGKAAASDYRVAGRADTTVTFGELGAPPTVKTGGTAVYMDRSFAACLIEVYVRYAWPPIFEPGQSVELPLVFQSVDGQNLIHTDDVRPVALAGGITARVLLDGANTGNPAASMLTYQIPAGGELPLARRDHDELWFVVAGAGSINGLGTLKPVPVGEGAAVFVAAGTARRAFAGEGGLTLLTVVVPGGEEATLRKGEAPWTPVEQVKKPPKKTPYPRVIGKAAATYQSAVGTHTILLDEEVVGSKLASLGRLVAQAGAEVPLHIHDTSTELLYIVGGGGAMTVGGVEMLVAAGDAIQIPAGVEHSFRVGADELVAAQIYTPAGPEQRFKAGTRLPAPSP
jgi:mannose-6-phosphate isomerase-like protein (cupin superfamily)